MANVIPKIGDLFGSKAQTLVNTVNCVGVMGKGIALEFKKRFPEMAEDYTRRCRHGEVRLGQPYLFKETGKPWILNFPTKDHWRSVSRLSDIVAGLDYLKANYKTWGITSLAVPPLGCGNGQLDWNVVGPALYRGLSKLEIPVELYAPHGTPPKQLELRFLEGDHGDAPQREPLRATVPPAAVALVGIVSRIDREPYHWPIGRTSFQKIAYFATERGIPTDLTYQRGSYGPYAANLKRLVAQLANNGLLAETRHGSMFVVRPGPTYPDARNQVKPLLKAWAPVIEQVADLFLRLQRTSDAEIAASVHYVAKELTQQLQGDLVPTEREVFEGVQAWKVRRRPRLDEAQVAETIRYLNILGWVNLRGSADLSVPEPELDETLT